MNIFFLKNNENKFIKARSLKRIADNELNPDKAEMLYQQSDRLLYQVIFDNLVNQPDCQKKDKKYTYKFLIFVINILIKLFF